MTTCIYVSQKSRMPLGDHFAILLYKNITIPGDERSRSAPGHGYPEHMESAVEYRAYLSRENWECDIRHLELARMAYSALVVTQPTITARIEISGVPNNA